MVDLIGFAHSRFGKWPGVELEALMREVAAEAEQHAGLPGSGSTAVHLAAQRVRAGDAQRVGVIGVETCRAWPTTARCWKGWPK